MVSVTTQTETPTRLRLLIQPAFFLDTRSIFALRNPTGIYQQMKSHQKERSERKDPIPP